jgi:indolepyruvate ferredoxin oxidoreductase beta subunit
VIGWFAGPRNVRTNSVFGYLSFYMLAKLRGIRRRSLIYQIEQRHIEQWLDAIGRAAPQDYSLAVELARCGRLVKGYGSTRERGNRNLQTILELQGGGGLSGTQVADLREAALADDEGRSITRLAAEVVGARAGSPAPDAARSAAPVTGANA